MRWPAMTIETHTICLGSWKRDRPLGSGGLMIRGRARLFAQKWKRIFICNNRFFMKMLTSSASQRLTVNLFVFFSFDCICKCNFMFEIKRRHFPDSFLSNFIVSFRCREINAKMKRINWDSTVASALWFSSNSCHRMTIVAVLSHDTR